MGRRVKPELLFCRDRGHKREEEAAEVNTWTTGEKILSDDTDNARSTEKKKKKAQREH